MEWPIRSHLFESMTAYSSALEEELKTRADQIIHRSFFDDERLYQPLKVVSYRRKEEDILREGAGMPNSFGRPHVRTWLDREKERMEKKQRPRAVSELLSRGGCIILGDPGAGKSELLRWAVATRLNAFRKAASVVMANEIVFPIFLSIPQLAKGSSKQALSTFAKRSLGHRDIMGDCDLSRVMVIKCLANWAETVLDKKLVRVLTQSLWAGWKTGSCRPFLALDGWDEVRMESDRNRIAPLLENLIQIDRAIVTSRIVGGRVTQTEPLLSLVWTY